MNNILDNLKITYSFPKKKPNTPPNEKIIMGWFTPNNQVLLKKYLLNKCSKKSIIIEFGVWLGMSTNFIAENTTSDSNIICVDWWKGDTSIGIRNNIKDELYKRYVDNVWSNKDKIIPIKMDGKEAAIYLSKIGIKPDLIYLDMGHSYEEVIDDLKVITQAFPETIIIGDDYLFWTGVKKAVVEIRYKYDIPYLNIDKNCYALVYEKDKKHMTYNNDEIGKNVDYYKNEEIQYSIVQENQYNKNKRIFIIPIVENNDIKKYDNIIRHIKKDLIIFVKSQQSIFTKFNHGYHYYIHYIEKNNSKNSKNISFIFVNPEYIVDIDYYKTINGFLSITTKLSNNKETYTSLENLSIDKKTMKILKNFPTYVMNNYVNRYFLFNNLIKNKIRINQLFSKKETNDFEIGHSQTDKLVMKKMEVTRNEISHSFDKIQKQMNRMNKLKINFEKKLSNNIYFIKI
jgi:hypothetical protein